MHPFDRHAAEYSRWERSATAQSWRARVMARCLRELPPGARVLDVGGGTGLDARMLIDLGYTVTSVEPSAGMRAQAAARGVVAEPLPAEDIGALSGTYGGALSNFGALNCLDEAGLDRFGAGLAARLAPRAAAILVVMAPVCLAESIVLLGTGRPRALARRRGWRASTVPLGAERVAVRWWTPRQLARALPGFRLEHVEALGAVAPPPDLHPGSARLRAVDAFAGALPLLRRAGDHTLCVFRRT